MAINYRKVSQWFYSIWFFCILRLPKRATSTILLNLWRTLQAVNIVAEGSREAAWISGWAPLQMTMGLPGWKLLFRQWKILGMTKIDWYDWCWVKPIMSSTQCLKCCFQPLSSCHRRLAVRVRGEMRSCFFAGPFVGSKNFPTFGSWPHG